MDIQSGDAVGGKAGDHHGSWNSKHKDQQYLHDKRNGKILTPDGLRFICEANGYDPEKIGKHLLEVLPKVLQKD